MNQIRLLSYFLEVAIVTVTFFITYFIADNFAAIYPFDLIPWRQVVGHPVALSEYMPAFGVAVGVWAAILWMRNGYRGMRGQTFADIAGKQLVNAGMFFIAFSSFAFLFKFTYLSRAFIILYTVTSLVSLTAARYLILSAARRIWRHGYYTRNIVLVGTGRRAQQFMSHVAKHPEWGYRILGLLDRESFLRGEKIAGYRVLGDLSDLPMVLGTHVVDEVVFITPRSWLNEVGDCIMYCEAVGVPATMAADLFELEIASGMPRKLEGMPYTTFKPPLLRESELLVKRLFDIVAASLILLVASPVLILVALLIKITSPGPVLFKQVRSGRNGRKFPLYKFRSMVVDAEKQLEKLKDKNEMTGPVFKMEKDPRITPIGRFLRMTSLDEFPQFINVLKGDMSVVGPRPPLPAEVEHYEPWQRRRLSMKPGITCIWQVSGRNQIGFEEWMHLDLKYIDNWSLWLDIKLLLLTGTAVVKGTGR